MNKFWLTISFLILNIRAFAQEEVEMADQFRGEGKIYVVVAVILIILFGIFFTLIRLDKKITRLEKEVRNKEKE